MIDKILGIDIAKGTFEVALIEAFWSPDPATRKPKEPKPHRRQFPNTSEGFRELQQWVKRYPFTALHVCLEATSTYGEALALFLHEAGHTVSVANPFQVKRYADGESQRTKNDRVDAAVVARFCRAHHPDPWTPPAPELRQLRDLSRYLDGLQGDLSRAQNRLSVPGHCRAVLTAMKSDVRRIERQMEKTRQLLRDHIQRHPHRAQQKDLLCSIPGIGEETARIILAELGDLNRFENSRQAMNSTGLDPCEWDSGSSVHHKPRISRRGNRRLRTALFYPAMSAIQCNPVLKAFYRRLREKELQPMQALAAVMRKMVKIAYAILRSGIPFDPDYHPAKYRQAIT